MKKAWKRFVKWGHLPIQDQLLLIRAFVIVVVIQISLRLLSFQQFRCLYGRLIASKEKTEISNQSIGRKIWAIQLVSRLVMAFCLPQALALTYLLKEDRSINLVVGIQKTHKFEAHAWVEKNGAILLGELPDVSFTPLWTWH